MKNRPQINLDLLKIAALASMTIDHVCKALLNSPDCFGTRVGRIAMPVYIFLAVYNLLYHTKNPDGYLKRLFGFAVISQLPFMYAFGVPYFALNTLFSLGFLVLLLQMAGRGMKESYIRYFLIILGLLACYLLFRTYGINLFFDYGFSGVAFGVSLYALFLYRTFEFGLFSAVLLWFINGNHEDFVAIVLYVPILMIAAFLPSESPKLQLPRKFKYLFYAYYPCHLAVLILIRQLFY